MSKDIKIGLMLYLAPMLIGAVAICYLTGGYTRAVLLTAYTLVMLVGFVFIMDEASHRELMKQERLEDKQKWEDRNGS